MPSDYVNFAFSIVYECGGKVYRSFRPSAVTDFDAGCTVAFPKSFSDLMSGPLPR